MEISIKELALKVLKLTKSKSEFDFSKFTSR